MGSSNYAVEYPHTDTSAGTEDGVMILMISGMNKHDSSSERVVTKYLLKYTRINK